MLIFCNIVLSFSINISFKYSVWTSSFTALLFCNLKIANFYFKPFPFKTVCANHLEASSEAWLCFKLGESVCSCWCSISSEKCNIVQFLRILCKRIFLYIIYRRCKTLLNSTPTKVWGPRLNCNKMR